MKYLENIVHIPLEQHLIHRSYTFDIPLQQERTHNRGVVHYHCNPQVRGTQYFEILWNGSIKSFQKKMENIKTKETPGKKRIGDYLGRRL